MLVLEGVSSQLMEPPLMKPFLKRMGFIIGFDDNQDNPSAYE